MTTTYAIAQRTDPKEPGWALFVTSDSYRGAVPGEFRTWCIVTSPSREQAMEHAFRYLSMVPDPCRIFLESVTDRERELLAHPSGHFSLLPEMPESVSTFLELARMVYE